MNKNIKKFVEQSKIEDKDELEKFSNSLLLECSKIIRNGGYWSGGPFGLKRQATPEEISTMLEEWFGVKNGNNKN